MWFTINKIYKFRMLINMPILINILIFYEHLISLWSFVQFFYFHNVISYEILNRKCQINMVDLIKLWSSLIVPTLTLGSRPR
jgi:hypothetical protein